MSCYTPKRKTDNGVEEITIPISVINGLSEELENLANKTIAMPMIRVANATDIDSTFIISSANPLIFSVEIIDGQLQEGDEVQICTRQLYTYNNGTKRRYRLRKEWFTKITSDNVDDRFIFVSIGESSKTKSQRLFRTGAASQNKGTLSPIYIRVRRPVYKDGTEVDGLFSNVVTVWKKYDRASSKIYIK